MPFDDILYLRQGELIVGQKVNGTNAPIEPVAARAFRTRISFDIGQDKSGNANKAKIMVYNLSQDSRSFLEQKNLVCFLNVGYESTGLTNLFFGDIDEKNGIHVERKGPDIITAIQAGDSEATLRDSNIQIGLAPGATNFQIIDAAIAILNVSISFKSDIKFITYQGGYSYAGSAKGLLDEMGLHAGFEWSLQNGELIILNPEDTDGQEAIFLSKDTGLIGFPTKTLDKVKFISLLNPKIRPGRAVRLESQIFLDGSGADVKVDKATFKGDTDEGPWETSVEGTIK